MVSRLTAGAGIHARHSRITVCLLTCLVTSVEKARIYCSLDYISWIIRICAGARARGVPRLFFGCAKGVVCLSHRNVTLNH